MNSPTWPTITFSTQLSGWEPESPPVNKKKTYTGELNTA